MTNSLRRCQHSKLKATLFCRLLNAGSTAASSTFSFSPPRFSISISSRWKFYMRFTSRKLRCHFFFLTPIKMPQNFLDSFPLNYLYIFFFPFFSNQLNSARCILMSKALTGRASKATARLCHVTLDDGGGVWGDAFRRSGVTVRIVFR